MVDENLSLLFVSSVVNAVTSFLLSVWLNVNDATSSPPLTVVKVSARIVAALAPALNAPVVASTVAPAFSEMSFH